MKKKNFKKFLKIKYIILAIFIIILILFSLKTASNDKNWNPDQQILTYSNISENQIQIYNIRNISYQTKDNFHVKHYNKTFNLKDLETLDYMIEELEGFPGFAHTLLSFGFKNNSYISVSVEIRKETHESYHPVSGLLKEYELMYVIADEKDVINLRANYRNDTVYLYPIKISKESLDKLFISMLEKTNQLKEKPEFYNTLTSTCTTNLAELASKNTNETFFKYHYQILLPRYSDELLLKKDLIKTNLTNIEDVRNYFKINKQARKAQYLNNFSQEIRVFENN